MKKIISAVAISVVGFTQLQCSSKEIDVAPINPGEELKVGTGIPALSGITWVQGEEVSKLNKQDEVYILECWATWCGPCVAVIPHMNELHKKFGDKGLTVIGMNVWEDGLEKVQGFVKNQGEKMSYRVAYSGGNKSEFTENWLKASKVKGIPTAFVVKNGKVIYIGHPSELDDKIVESMLAKGFDPSSFMKSKEAQKQLEAEFDAKLRPLIVAKDWQAVKALVTVDPLTKDTELGLMILTHTNTALKDWDALSKLAEEVQAGKFGGKASINTLVVSFLDTETSDKVKAFAKKMVTLVNVKEIVESGDVMLRMGYARALFISGDAKGAEEQAVSLKSYIEAKFKGNPGAQQFVTELGATIEQIKKGKFPPMSPGQ